jgi:hypothetical protein
LCASEIAKVPLIWSTATVPEKQPLHNLALLEFILEPKTIVLVKFVHEVEKFCRGLHNGKRGRVSIVNDDGNST